MSTTPNPTLSHAATAPQRAAAQKAPVRRMNRVPLFIAAGTMGLIAVGGIAVAIDRAHRRTAEPPKMADPSTSEALARRFTAGRPDGTIAPKAPATPADPAQPPAAAPSPGSAQPPISRQAAAAAPQGDTMEEVRKRLALQRYERLEQEKQRQELAVIQGHDEALSSPRWSTWPAAATPARRIASATARSPAARWCAAASSRQPPRLGPVSSPQRPPWARPRSTPLGRAEAGTAPRRASRHRP